jgi:hypothetical protein
MRVRGELVVDDDHPVRAKGAVAPFHLSSPRRGLMSLPDEDVLQRVIDFSQARIADAGQATK